MHVSAISYTGSVHIHQTCRPNNIPRMTDTSNTGLTFQHQSSAFSKVRQLDICIIIQYTLYL